MRFFTILFGVTIVSICFSAIVSDALCVDNIPTFDTITKYCVLDKESWADANTECNRMGGTLAEIFGPDEFAYLANKLQQKYSPAWVGSWNTDDYQKTPLVFYSGGAITPPTSNINYGLCELPV
ncbi:537_t:CDS:1 [Ambispora gerdemannii]|uniref:537_t:CDS:1 n=1 Tax=Ambispora gerdemannii TaxID=144530 RepID=A0A9N9FDK0_9GLOM|nr:537_t:CDS:1 [Ambispora gerdemannii]